MGAPLPPPRRVTRESLEAAPLRCVKRFGSYSTVRMQTSSFKWPTSIDVSDTSGDVLVVDSIYMTVRLFTKDGDYMSMFRVQSGVTSACFTGSGDILVAGPRGVAIHTSTGDMKQDLPIGHVIAVASTKFGFVAAQRKQLLLFRNNADEPYRTITKAEKRGPFQSKAFKSIQDVCFNSLKELVVLDTGSQRVFVISGSGRLRATVRAHTEPCGSLLAPHSVTCDKWNNILVSDTGNGRLLKFSANGTFSRCLLNVKLLHEAKHDLSPQGVAVSTTHDRIFVVMTATEQAYVAVYQLT